MWAENNSYVQKSQQVKLGFQKRANRERPKSAAQDSESGKHLKYSGANY